MKRCIKKLSCIILVIIFLLNFISFDITNIAVSENSKNETSKSLSNDLEVTFLNVGTGDCTFIKYKDTEILIDSGEKEGNSDVFVTISFLKKFIVEKCTDKVLEYVITTHGDSDHLGIMSDVLDLFNEKRTNEMDDDVKKQNLLKDYKIRNIIDFDNKYNKGLFDSLKYKNYISSRESLIKNYKTNYNSIDSFWENEKTGEIDSQKEVSVKLGSNDNAPIMYFLYNEYYFKKTTDSKFKNAISICTYIKFGQSSVLLTGDLEEIDSGANPVEFYGETKLYENNKSIISSPVTLFKAGHHGSNTSNSEKFIDEIRPQYVAISTTANSKSTDYKNYWGFPRQSVLNNFLKYTDYIFITAVEGEGVSDQQYYGNISFVLNKEGTVSVSCSNEKMKRDNRLKNIVETDWFKQNRESLLNVYSFSSVISENNAYIGNCTLVKYGHIDILVDCGVYGSIGGNAILSSNFIEQIKKYCVDGIIEYCVVTSASSSSLQQMVDLTSSNQNIPGILSLFKIEHLIDYGTINDPTESASRSLYKAYNEKKADLIKILTENNYYSAFKNQGQVINVCENLSIEILKSDYYQQKNDNDVCLMVNFLNQRMLFTGNITKEAEISLIENNNLSNVVYYKASFFGFNGSNSEEILNSIKNDRLYIVINSIANKNILGYETLSKSTCDRIINSSAKHFSYLTAEFIDGKYKQVCGDITFSIYSKNNDTRYSLRGSNSTIRLCDTNYYKNLK